MESKPLTSQYNLVSKGLNSQLRRLIKPPSRASIFLLRLIMYLHPSTFSEFSTTGMSSFTQSSKSSKTIILLWTWLLSWQSPLISSSSIKTWFYLKYHVIWITSSAFSWGVSQNIWNLLIVSTYWTRCCHVTIWGKLWSLFQFSPDSTGIKHNVNGSPTWIHFQFLLPSPITKLCLTVLLSVVPSSSTCLSNCLTINHSIKS